MKVTSKSRRNIRLQNILFVLLFIALIGVLGWLSTRYHYQSDWTAVERNTLSGASIALLAEMKGPVTVTLFSADNGALRKDVARMMARYQRHKSDLSLTFVNPDTEPALVRELDVKVDGELLFEYQGRRDRASRLDEQSISNALQRLSRSAERWLVFVEGHGERNPFGQANHDLQIWGQQLEAKGFKLRSHNFAVDAFVPEDTSVLVIASPQVAYLPGEVALIENYISAGGNLLWLAEPEERVGLDSVAEQIGVEFEPGVIVDPTAQQFQIDNPTFVIVGDYGLHPLTREFELLTVFPRAMGLVIEAQGSWQTEAFLLTSGQSWAETGELAGEVELNDNEDIAGPLSIGVSASRHLLQNENDEADLTASEGGRQQRIVVMGDGDFISNSYLGNAGNLDLGMNVVNWLSSDDQLLSIPVKTALDTSLTLSQTQSVVIGVVFLLLLPGLLLGSGLMIWLKRRKA